jgi:L-ribulose-5-phosphate 3-epimerase
MASAGVITGSLVRVSAGDHFILKSRIPAKPTALSINVFSKNLHWLDYTEMAQVAAELGFDGVDLTVRAEGHVLPERVTEDLPKAVEAVKKVGLQVYMITTGIKSADELHTETILKTAGSLGISYYRMGWISYDSKKSVAENLKAFHQQLSDLAELNKKYNICGDYQNHSGSSLGSPVWDLWMSIKDLDPQWMGSQYDIMHATVEGANSWPLGMDLLKSHIHTLDFKDFIWQKSGSGWKTQVVPLGEGMIDFKRYFKLVKEFNLRGPLSMHYEYPLGGIENGATKLTMKREEVLAAMKRDLVALKQLLRDAELS